MASFVEVSIKNRLTGDRLFTALEDYLTLYEAKTVVLDNCDKLILGTTPQETKSLYARNELKIREILCKYAFKTYLKTVVWVIFWTAIVFSLMYFENEYATLAMGPLIVFCMKYTRTCKDWLFQDKQKNCLKRKKAEEEKDV